jgi:hypothetical protein
MKRVCFCLVAALAGFLLYQFCEKETAGFSVAKIAPAANEQGKENLPEGVAKILEQKFHYFAKGGQAFVFLSEDGKYVLKFLRRRFCPEFLLSFPLPKFLKLAIEKKRAYVQKKWKRDAKSYELARDELSSETGLLWLHLNRSSQDRAVEISDKLNIVHKLNLDQHAFLLQKRAEPILTHLEWQIRQKKIDEAKKTLDQMIALVLLRLDKQIVDEDLHLDKNLGFLEGKPVFIDIGRLKKEERAKNPQEARLYLSSLFARLKKWLGEQDPDLANYLTKMIQDLPDPTDLDIK